MNTREIEKLIVSYKAHLKKGHLKDELYKWQLLAKFKGRPRLDAPDFSAEIKSIDYSNLLYYNALSVTKELADRSSEGHKACLKGLFNENTSLVERIKAFDTELLKIYRELNDHHGHHHDERTIATFLTFQNPDKYTFYKDSYYKKYCDLIGVVSRKKGEKYVHYLELVDDLIENYIKKDEELIELFQEIISSDDCYKDPNFKILAQDILYQMFDKPEPPAENHQQRVIQYWLYSPGEKATYWDEFYNESIMALGWDALGDLMEYEGREAIQKELQKGANTTKLKYNDTSANDDFRSKMQVDDVIFVKRGRGELLGYGIVKSNYYFDDTRSYYKHCREVEWKKRGIWKTDHSLVLKTLTDITDYKTKNPNFDYYYQALFAFMNKTMENKKNDYPAPLNQILYGPPGTGKTYSTIELAYRAINGDAAYEQFGYNEAKKWFKTELTKGEDRQLDFITFHQNYSYEDFVMGIKPDLNEGDGLNFIRHEGIFYKICQRALKNYEDSQKPVEVIEQEKGLEELFDEFKNEIVDQIDTSPNGRFELSESVYTETVFDDAFSYTGDNWKHQHRMKFSDILKIYKNSNAISRKEAKRTPDISRTATEHMTYFFKMVSLFREFTKNHKIDVHDIKPVSIKNYAIIIDEINRANISRVFGELITLIEEDKRWGNNHAMEVRLPDGYTSFTVPKNLYIIGTMNTADKSIALLDIALRRRFEFTALYPDSSKVTTKYKTFFEALNEQIIAKKGVDFTIGHSYFMTKDGEELDFVNTMNKRVIPLLNEYFYNVKGNKVVAELVKDAIAKAGLSNTIVRNDFQLLIQ